MWWHKFRWYERNQRFLNRWRLNRHMAKAGAYIRFPVEGEVLEALDSGRLTLGQGTLLEPGCWITLAPDATIAVGDGCFLNRGVMLAAHDRLEIGAHVLFANNCPPRPASPHTHRKRLRCRRGSCPRRGCCQCGARCVPRAACG